MKSLLIILFACSCLSGVGEAKLNVVATTPDLGALATEIGGDRVEVKVLAKPTEDPHFADAKPSHIVTLNRADVLIEGGAELEIGWLPALLESSRNVKIGAGGPGRIVASRGITMLEVPTSFDRSKGDVHALGNPHFLLDPLNAKIVAGQIAERFTQLDPPGKESYQAKRAQFDSALDAKLGEWQKRLAPYQGAKIVTYHRDFQYFANRFGLEVIETLEPKPGIPPSAAHLAKVIEKMKVNGARVILIQPFQSHKTAESAARPTNAKVLDFPQQPGAIKNTETYIKLMDYLVGTLASTLKEKP